MPLIDNTTTRIDIDEDWYILGNELGFYEETIMLVDAVSPTELIQHNPDEGKKEGIVVSDQTPGEMVARRNFSRIRSYLVDWSHTEIPKLKDSLKLPLTPQNIQRIKREDARILLRRIEELEDSASKPFRGEPTD